MSSFSKRLGKGKSPKHRVVDLAASCPVDAGLNAPSRLADRMVQHGGFIGRILYVEQFQGGPKLLQLCWLCLCPDVTNVHWTERIIP